jgi:nucleoside-diphosphate-sugar epimerase
MYFAAAAEAAAKGAQFTVPGSEDGRMSMVHVDDLADLYLRAAERVSSLCGTCAWPACSRTQRPLLSLI